MLTQSKTRVILLHLMILKLILFSVNSCPIALPYGEITKTNTAGEFVYSCRTGYAAATAQSINCTEAAVWSPQPQCVTAPGGSVTLCNEIA